MAMYASNNPRWSLGIDPGDQSIGLTGIEYDDDGDPVKILSAVSFMHDGGRHEGKTIPESRKARAGVARRTRNLQKRRVRRLAELRRFLADNGMDPGVQDEPQTDLAWRARSRLSREFVQDPDERARLLGRAILHIAHHRGWRNPWKGLASLRDLPQPSESLAEMLDFAKLRFPDETPPRTIGDLGALSAGTNQIRVRPRETIKHTKKTEKIALEDRPSTTPLFFNQIKQEDVLHELDLILTTQQLDKALADEIIKQVFTQNKPYVKAESVGIDPFDGSPRAPRASLEFQEFRIRDKVANLRRNTKGYNDLLPPETTDKIVQHLLTYKKADPITWIELAELFGIPEKELHVERSSDGTSLKAPLNETLSIMSSSKVPKKVRTWWNSVSFDEQSELVLWLADSVQGDPSDAVADLLEQLDDDEQSDLAKLTFPSGRSTYGLATLRTLNAMMADEKDEHGNKYDHTTARQVAFDTPADWRPPLPSFESHTGQPTVDRNLEILRRYLLTATQKWGPPKRVVIELYRDKWISAKDRLRIENEQRRNRERNDAIRSELIASGTANPQYYDIRRKRLLQVQDMSCLYCGATLTMNTCKLNHIVPRADGGRNQTSNLAAVCHRCNEAKDRMTFYQFASSGKVPEVTFEGVITRVSQWQQNQTQLDKKAFETYKADVIRRLSRKTRDEDIDDMSYASTAYAAVEIRDRVESFLVSHCGIDPKEAHKRVVVVNGKVTSLARQAARFDRIVNLRDLGVDKTLLDRRHNALDALIASSVTPMVAQALVVLDEKRQVQSRDDRFHWDSEQAIEKFTPDVRAAYLRWLPRAKAVAELAGEAVAKDRIVVVNAQHRLGVSVGRLHKDKLLKLHRMPFGAAMTTDEINRVVNPEIYSALREIESLAAKKRRGVEADETRELYLKGKGTLRADDVIEVFPLDSKDGYLRTSNGCVKMGSFHHSRVYAWKEAKGKIQFGQIRVYAGEMAKIGLTKNVDLFTHPLPLWSESYRMSNNTLLKAIQNDKAVQIGWLAVGDEFDFGTPKDVPESGDVNDFLALYPETKWSLDGLPNPTGLRLRPMYLSEEGLDDNSETVLTKFVKRPGWLLAINVAMNSQNLTVIRRTVIGAPRWKGEHQPISWKPYQVAKDLLG